MSRNSLMNCFENHKQNVKNRDLARILGVGCAKMKIGCAILHNSTACSTFYETCSTFYEAGVAQTGRDL